MPLTTSVRSLVAAAVKTTLLGNGVLDAASVVLRKKAEHDPGYDQQPSVVIVSEKETVNGLTFDNRVFLRYPVLVLIVQARSLLPESAVFESDLRELIRKSLWKPGALSLASYVQQDAGYDPQPGGWNPGTWGKSFDVSAQRFTFEVTEPRAFA